VAAKARTPLPGEEYSQRRGWAFAARVKADVRERICFSGAGTGAPRTRASAHHDVPAAPAAGCSPLGPASRRSELVSSDGRRREHTSRHPSFGGAAGVDFDRRHRRHRGVGCPLRHESSKWRLRNSAQR
jgi:hypothetical protein